MSSTREEVFAALESERAYQERQWGTVEEHPMEVGSHLTLLRALLSEAEYLWTHTKGDAPTLEFVRKIAAAATACMEQHGAPKRLDLSAMIQPCNVSTDLGPEQIRELGKRGPYHKYRNDT